MSKYKLTKNAIFMPLPLLFILHLSAATQDEAESAAVAETTSVAEVSPTFAADSKALAKTTATNNQEWIEARQQQHLVIKTKFKGKTLRGHAVIFHAQGENPKHDRIVLPLSQQLAELGWSIWSPNIAKSDFPEVPETPEQTSDTPAENETSSQEQQEAGNQPPSSESNKSKTQNESENAEIAIITRHFFENSESYQGYFTEVCQETLKLVPQSDLPTIIIANGNAAFWSLDCIAQIVENLPVILIRPSAPRFASKELNEMLNKGQKPLMTFSNDLTAKSKFEQLIQNGSWNAANQRFDNSHLLNNKLNRENISVAKSISGWVRSMTSTSE